ncbi:DUF2279 domain-containing protein [Sphingobium fuliginis]|uniref:DUF2279 domain-containing protein n=1 Tax=Sphingobium fuliginis (strain ATCC 27551) TaxID=336203 RepID=UPI0020C78804|nr:DUF2279 domain-containing protein [Sphingobium fuliginis]
MRTAFAMWGVALLTTMSSAHAALADPLFTDLVDADGVSDENSAVFDLAAYRPKPPHAVIANPTVSDPIEAWQTQKAFTAPEPVSLSWVIMSPTAAFTENVEEGTVASEPRREYRSLGSRIGAAKWEMLGIMAYTTTIQTQLTHLNTGFHFHDEGWFGRNTTNLGIDKLTHAFNGYLFSEFLGWRIARKTGDRARAAIPSAIMGFGLQLYGEMFDAFKTSSGFSVQDVVFNGLGASFSAARHIVPGLASKIDFRLMLMPNKKGFSRSGKKHYEQQRFLLSLELAGFKTFENSPLRFVELQVGYRGKNFSNRDRAMGIKPDRDIFFGVALNLKEIFFQEQSFLCRSGDRGRSGLFPNTLHGYSCI